VDSSLARPSTRNSSARRGPQVRDERLSAPQRAKTGRVGDPAKARDPSKPESQTLILPVRQFFKLTHGLG